MSQKPLSPMSTNHHREIVPIYPSALPSAVATERLLVDDTSRVTYSRVQTGLEDPILLLYLLLALSMVLLFTSLSLALVVFLRRARAESSNPGPKEAKHNQECRIQHGQEVGQPGQSFKGMCGMDKSQRPQCVRQFSLR